MLRRHEEQVRPRNGHTLMVAMAGRISGCQGQKELSLEDQEDNGRETIVDLYIGPAEYRVIAATKAKGERLDRPELKLIEEAYRSGEYDLFIFDDLSRLIRGYEAVRLLGVGVDNGTRTLCIADGIDTNDPTWEEDALNACSENVAHNERTSKRIKQKSMNRFKKFGQPTGRPIAGYHVPPGVKSYDGWQKQENWIPVIQEAKRLLLETCDCFIVADYFNDQGFPVGPYARRKTWNGPMVRRYFGNPLLKGKPQRGTMHTVKHHGTGRRKSVKNPKGPNYYDAPHLAFLTEQEFDDLNVLLDEKNGCHRRKTVNGTDPLWRRSRSQSIFPGMHARCCYCGHHYVWGANGMVENLMCSNSREWRCWHSIGFCGPVVTQKLVAEIRRQLSGLNGFDEQFAGMVKNAGSGLAEKFDEEWRNLHHDEALHQRQEENLGAAIAEVGLDELLTTKLAAIKANRLELLKRRHRLERRGQRQLVLPQSMAALLGMLEEEFQQLAFDSPAFGKFMRSLIPEFYVYAVRLCDGGHLLPRAKLRLNLAGTYPDVNLIPGLAEMLTQDVTLDLFEAPQRERIREEAAQLHSSGMGPKAISQIIAEKPTATAVQNALALHRQMLSLGLSSPYVTLQAPPDDYPKLRRHKHTRYRFEPLDGYQPPAL